MSSIAAQKLDTEIIGLKTLAEARSWVGTPWRRDVREKGRGVNCLTFIGMVFKARGILTDLPPVRPFDERFWEDPHSDLLQEGIDDGMRLLSPKYRVEVGPASIATLEHGDMFTVMCLPNDERATHACFFQDRVANQIIVVDCRTIRHGGVRVQPMAPSWRPKNFYRIHRQEPPR